METLLQVYPQRVLWDNCLLYYSLVARELSSFLSCRILPQCVAFQQVPKQQCLATVCGLTCLKSWPFSTWQSHVFCYSNGYLTKSFEAKVAKLCISWWLTSRGPSKNLYFSHSEKYVWLSMYHQLWRKQVLLRTQVAWMCDKQTFGNGANRKHCTSVWRSQFTWSLRKKQFTVLKMYVKL